MIIEQPSPLDCKVLLGAMNVKDRSFSGRKDTIGVLAFH